MTGEELKNIRLSYGASRQAFSKYFLGISRTMVYFYETNKTTIPELVEVRAKFWAEKMKEYKQAEVKLG